jgi:hypothetical protein
MLTIEQKFRGIIPDNTVSGAISFLNTLDWNLNVYVKDGHWILLSGDQKVITAPNEDEMNSFILGMAMGLAILPDQILEVIRKTIEP